MRDGVPVVVAVCRVCHRIHCQSLLWRVLVIGLEIVSAPARRPPRCVRRSVLVAGRVFLLRRLDPFGEVAVVHDAHRNRHECVVLAAKLGALAVEHSLLRRLEPGVVDAAGNGVDLDAERWHREGMDHVGAGHQHVDDLVHRHDQLAIGGEQARLTGLQILVGDNERVVFEIAVIRITVAPVPLLAGRLHGEIGLRLVELEKEEAERRHRDHHQDDHRNDRPDDFERRIVGGARGRRIGARIEAQHDDQQENEDEDGDRGGDEEQEIMKADDVGHHRRAGILQAEFPGRRLPEAGERRSRAREQHPDGHRSCGQA